MCPTPPPLTGHPICSNDKSSNHQVAEQTQSSSPMPPPMPFLRPGIDLVFPIHHFGVGHIAQDHHGFTAVDLVVPVDVRFEIPVAVLLGREALQASRRHSCRLGRRCRMLTKIQGIGLRHNINDFPSSLNSAIQTIQDASTPVSPARNTASREYRQRPPGAGIHLSMA